MVTFTQAIPALTAINAAIQAAQKLAEIDVGVAIKATDQLDGAALTIMSAIPADQIPPNAAEILGVPTV